MANITKLNLKVANNVKQLHQLMFNVVYNHQPVDIYA